LFSKLFFGTHISSSSSWDFFKLLFFVFRKNLSQKEERSTEKTTKTPTTRLSTFLRYYPIGRTCVVALSVSFSLSLFCKGEEEEEEKTCRR
tara:strand:- start:489 stop:761 length:273 start_codon:yes stop_codon:yes gene_type:complete